MGVVSKDTLDIKYRRDSSIEPLKSCILIPTPDGGKYVKKAKSVHFADSLGKPLKSIKTLYDLEDEIDLLILGFNRNNVCRKFSAKPRKMTRSEKPSTLVNDCARMLTYNFVNFTSSDGKPKIFEQVLKHYVLLENINVQQNGIFGTVNVKNISFEKDVTITYTLDKWKTVEKTKATYVPGSSTGSIDIFSFEIAFSESKMDFELQFAICFKVGEIEYWDSNASKNYIISFVKKYEKNKNIIINNDLNLKGFVIKKQEFIGWVS